MGKVKTTLLTYCTRKDEWVCVQTGNMENHRNGDPSTSSKSTPVHTVTDETFRWKYLRLKLPKVADLLKARFNESVKSMKSSKPHKVSNRFFHFYQVCIY